MTSHVKKLPKFPISRWVSFLGPSVGYPFCNITSNMPDNQKVAFRTIRLLQLWLLNSCWVVNYTNNQYFCEKKRRQTLRKIAAISPNFLLWRICGNGQFPQSFGRFAQNYAETGHFHKTSTLRITLGTLP